MNRDEFIRLARHDGIRLLFVDDGSKRPVLAELAAAVPGKIEVLSLERNSGKAEAVRRGLASPEKGATLVGYIDADLSGRSTRCCDSWKTPRRRRVGRDGLAQGYSSDGGSSAGRRATTWDACSRPWPR